MAEVLRQQGYQAYAIRGGLDAWVDAGLPTEPRAVETARTLRDLCPNRGLPVSAHNGQLRGH